MATIYGTAGADSRDGTSAADAIYGGPSSNPFSDVGNDTLSGLGGADTINGYRGNDTLDGGEGDDTLDGGFGTDTASYLSAFIAVTLSLAFAGAQNTVGAGMDTLISIENLTGGQGDDHLTGNTGANVLDGAGGNDTLDGGIGNDTATYASSTAGVTVSLAIVGPQDTGGAGIDTLISMESLRGGSGNDSLTGSDRNNIIEGGLGNDTMTGNGGGDMLSYETSLAAVTVSLAITTAQDTGGAGIDTATGFRSLRGGWGNDVLIGNAASNALAGMAGDDIIRGGGGNNAIDGGEGRDTVDYTGFTGISSVGLSTGGGRVTTNATIDSLVSIEVLRLGSKGDSVSIENGSFTVFAGDGDDTLRGGTDGDTLFGQDGNDSLIGGDGNDTLFSGAGFDTLDGGAGTDTASYEDAYFRVIVDLEDPNERLSLIENVTGSTFNDILMGNSGANVLRGGDGKDWLYGRAGDDLLVGGLVTTGCTPRTGRTRWRAGTTTIFTSSPAAAPS
ncbi:calcium-binding protein [Roseomonas populi]|uniref:Calcium-binding protein n=1 Tax=Roseomonas populi TaxID=3121582 RepID=A0ABT1XC91_9PROT|nr:calcium-binding protein [Roseomonas pecuniae]MCR0985737.1 calcium-binding protein [Roseomonas pecuniae]